MDDFLGRTGWRWSAEPASWVAVRDTLAWRCRAKTDFWRVTEGQGARHDGQAYLAPVDGDFRLEGVVHAVLADRYDQAGLFVEADEQRWLKLGVELDGSPWLSAVHTSQASDWSREPIPGLPLRLAVERRDDTVTCSAHVDDWRVFRVLHLPGPVSVGPYSCAPEGGGFEASLRDASLTG
jgi:regulation of enolase protein 1 (concanavalin A-like superfamily)